MYISSDFFIEIFCLLKENPDKFLVVSEIHVIITCNLMRTFENVSSYCHFSIYQSKSMGFIVLPENSVFHVFTYFPVFFSPLNIMVAKMPIIVVVIIEFYCLFFA